MSSLFKPARRTQAKLRLALAGPSGSGKTYSALLIAFGLGGRVAVIDTERGSASLYAHLGPYDTCELAPPFTPDKYIQAIRAAESAGYDVIVIDSLSHAWAGPGGILDMHDRASAKEKNSWAAWRHVTPKHNDLVDTILQSRAHIIATMRAKQEYVQVEDGGKRRVQRVGLAPVQRDGIEYEFTLVLDLDASHTAIASKDRTSLFDGQVFRPDQETGKALLAWLTEAKEETVEARKPPERHPSPETKETFGAAGKAYESRVILISSPRKGDVAWEADAVDLVVDRQVTLVGSLSGLAEGQVLQVKGTLFESDSGNRVAVNEYVSEKQQDAPDGPLTKVIITSAPKKGKKDFGGILKEVAWAYAEKDGVQVIVAGVDDGLGFIMGLNAGQEVEVPARIVEENGKTVLYVERAA